ncbi:MAG TPA: hypothetical protein VFJ12_09375 [Segeticoccus sp.]|nr:hypothetical protein [Segeticoccus sp.]
MAKLLVIVFENHSAHRAMYEETGPDGKRAYTVAQIATEFGVTRPTIYRHLAHPEQDLPRSRDSS